MYLMTTHIPVYSAGDRWYTDVSWQADLLLARDWLARPFGGLTLLAPWQPVSSLGKDVMALKEIGRGDGIQVRPSFDSRCRAREFWAVHRRRWMQDLHNALPGAAVIHVSASDVFRPLAFLALEAGVSSNAATVLVGPDMDPHATVEANLRGRLYCMAFDLLMARALRAADLALLKEGLVYDRYARHGKNVRSFCHSMHSEADVIGEEHLQARLATLAEARPLRAVYAGRFVARKGLAQAIATVAAAIRAGTAIEYHLYGGGPEESRLRQQAAELGVAHCVHFHGHLPYDDKFIAELARYDLLLFLPVEEDTPRMLYDALAAGLPLVGTPIPFLAQRVARDGVGVLVASGDEAAAELRRLRDGPSALQALSRTARDAGSRHAREAWYRRRAEWTREACERRHLAVRHSR